MQFSYLRTFVTIVERGGFSAAAQVLGISQPAVSQQVNRLEQEMGIALLQRDRRGILAVTAGGETLIAFARQVLAAYDALQKELIRQKDVIEGELHLAASTTPGEYLVPKLMADFCARHANVRAQVTVSDTTRVIRQLLAGECDVGFIGAPIEQLDLTLQHLATDTVVLAVYPGHPFEGQHQVTWQQVLEQPLILREQGSGTRLTVERTLVEHKLALDPASVALTLGSTQAIVQAIRDRLGIGFVSQRAIARVPTAENLPTVTIEGLDFSRELFIVHRAQYIATPLVQAFLTFVRTDASGQPRLDKTLRDI